MITVLASMMLFTSCKKDDMTGPVDNGTDFTIEETTLPPMDAPAGDIQEADLDQPMGFRHPQPRFKSLILLKVLRAMELDDEQKEQVRTYLKEHLECVREAQMILRKSQMEIIRKANAIRDSLMKEYRDGNMTREELRNALRRLNRATLEKLRNNPVRERVLQRIIKCRETLYANIGDILNEDQLKIWERFLNYLEEHDRPRDRRRLGLGDEG